METFFFSAIRFTADKFKSYYVVWKLANASLKNNILSGV